MKLRQLLKGLEYSVVDENLLKKDIIDIKIDHRAIEKGDMFIALSGRNYDGNLFSDKALEKGASVIIENNLTSKESVKVADTRKAFAVISKNYFSSACDDLKIIAVTGTNGKTTTCNTIADVLRMNGKKVGVIGTLGAKIDGKVEDTGFTTPDPYALHSIFAKMKDAGNEYVIMEASAHALELNKLEGIKFEVGVLTNITEDHLDYFETMDNYAKAKFKLFEKDRIKQGIVCSGKDYVDKLLKTSEVPIYTYGFDKNSDFAGEVVQKNFNGSIFNFNFNNENCTIMTPLVGQYNLENALASVAVCKCLGLDNCEIKKGMSCTLPVEGRFNIVHGNKCNIIIDYAHTPDGLEKVLTTARELTKGDLVVIFGCGGNRDRQKRPIMGRIASEIADKVILTSDNPRFENPMDIIEEIQMGIKGDYQIIENRKQAINYALSTFKHGETIVIAGKGAEKYQEIRGTKHPYNDFDVICEFYKKVTTKDEMFDEDEKC